VRRDLLAFATVWRALRQAVKSLARAGEMIAARLREAQVVGCDETGARLSTDALDARMAWEMGAGQRPRGRDVLDELMAGHRQRIGDRSLADLEPDQLAHQPGEPIVCERVCPLEKRVAYTREGGEFPLRCARGKLGQALFYSRLAMNGERHCLPIRREGNF